MTDSIAAAILDWVDDDDAPRPSGAESDYYRGRGLPYGPRNATPTSLDELLLVRDLSRQRLFGADADFNYRVGDREMQSVLGGPGLGMAEAAVPWASLLTVYGAERNTSYEGQPRIYLNENDLGKLHGQLKEVFDSSWADFIIAYRQFGPQRKSARGRSRSRVKQAITADKEYKQPKQAKQAKQARTARGGRGDFELDLSLPAKYRLASALDLIGAEVGLPDPERTDSQVPQDRVLKSPLEDDPVAMREYLPSLLDKTTTTRSKVIRGRVNVNLAPRAVLEAVPGMEASTVGQVVAARGAQFGRDDENRRHPTWLLTEGIVDLAQMKKLMPYLTTGGDVFRAQVVSFFDDKGPSARAEVVVDATVSPPRQVYWKDLRLLGRGYPLEALGAEPPVDATSRPAEADDFAGSSQFE
jgi:hypothetical protein